MSSQQYSTHDDSQLDGEALCNDLEWAAFRYVAGEMSEEEGTAFELQLAESEPAREAVARTVQMTHAIVGLPDHAALPATAGGSANSGLRRSARWSAAATIMLITAFCAMVAIGLRFSNVEQTPQSPTNRLTSSSPGAIESAKGRDLVIAAWLDFQPVEKLPEESLISDDPVALAPVSEIRAGDDDGKFDWIVAAIDPEEANNGGLNKSSKEEQ